MCKKDNLPLLIVRQVMVFYRGITDISTSFSAAFIEFDLLCLQSGVSLIQSLDPKCFFDERAAGNHARETGPVELPDGRLGLLARRPIREVFREVVFPLSKNLATTCAPQQAIVIRTPAPASLSKTAARPYLASLLREC